MNYIRALINQYYINGEIYKHDQYGYDSWRYHDDPGRTNYVELSDYFQNIYKQNKKLGIAYTQVIIYQIPQYANGEYQIINDKLYIKRINY